MARIIVDPPPTGHDVLAADFLKALTVLHDGGFELRSGTKLTSRYAVLVVEDSAADPAIEKLSLGLKPSFADRSRVTSEFKATKSGQAHYQ